MVTPTPSSDAGRLPLTTSSLCQMRPGLVLDRFVPRMVTQEPASMPGWKLAASTTDAMAGAAGGTSLATNTKPGCPAGGCTPPGTGKSADQVWPATITLPCESAATASAPSSSEPPKYVE